MVISQNKIAGSGSKTNLFLFLAKKYLKYILTSTNGKGHGIHSPFVFDLVTRVFRNKTDPGIVSIIEALRKKLILDPGYIVVRDFGTGPERIGTSLRKVSDIARYSSLPLKYGVLMSNMAAEFGNPVIIELGTSIGISTMYMALANPEATIYTIEGCPSISEIANENFREAGIKNIELMTGTFEELLPVILKRNIRPGLVFIDGDHRKEKTIKYFFQIMQISDSKTVIILDDINYSKDMEDAWNEIKHFEKVSLTIDLFRMGIVFFRERINHRDYVIRY
jgi:predicted O-methyltransferase YrrM